MEPSNRPCKPPKWVETIWQFQIVTLLYAMQNMSSLGILSNRLWASSKENFTMVVFLPCNIVFPCQRNQKNEEKNKMEVCWFCHGWLKGGKQSEKEWVTTKLGEFWLMGHVVRFWLMGFDFDFSLWVFASWNFTFLLMGYGTFIVNG